MEKRKKKKNEEINNFAGPSDSQLFNELLNLRPNCCFKSTPEANCILSGPIANTEVSI
jgi:hypothetical protein